MISDRDAEILKITNVFDLDFKKYIFDAFKNDREKSILLLKLVYVSLFDSNKSFDKLKNINELIKLNKNELKNIILRSNIIPDQIQNLEDIFNSMDNLLKIDYNESKQYVEMIVNSLPLFFEPKKFIKDYEESKNVYQKLNFFIENSILSIGVYGDDIKNLSKKYIYSKLSSDNNIKNHEDLSLNYLDEIRNKLKSTNPSIEIDVETENIRKFLDEKIKEIENLTNKIFY